MDQESLSQTIDDAILVISDSLFQVQFEVNKNNPLESRIDVAAHDFSFDLSGVPNGFYETFLEIRKDFAGRIGNKIYEAFVFLGLVVIVSQQEGRVVVTKQHIFILEKGERGQEKIA